MQWVSELYVAHASAVRDKLRTLGLDNPDLEDLLQDTFMVAARKRAKLPKNGKRAKAWLVVTARKLAANWRRLQRHSFETFGLAEVIDRAAAEPEDPEGAYIARDLVQYALRRLSAEDRDILVSHGVGGRSVADLAAQLGMTKSGAYVRLQRARAQVPANIMRLRARGTMTLRR
jgi:RNA polymerase sigma-70 factor, ECF subfamily